MKTTMKLGGAMAAAVLAIGLGAGGVLAQGQDKAAVIKDRQDTMKSMGQALGGVKAFTEDKADLKQAQDSADRLVQIIKTVGTKFQPGTSMADAPNVSWAKPELWTDKAKFDDALKNATAEVEKLDAAVKTGDKGKITAQFADTGKNGCGGCHTPFRQAKPS
jgi:cytochrome c556